MTVNAQIIDDNFDSYTLGDMADQNPDVWSVWSGNINSTAESIGVSDAFAASGTQAGFIGAGPGPQDAILRLGNLTTGTYELSFNMYIPEGKTGYFNIQGMTTASGGAGSGGNGVFNSSNLVFNNIESASGMGGLGGSYPNTAGEPDFTWEYPEDAWFPVLILFEPDSNRWTMTVDDVVVAPQEFEDDGVIGGIDFFGINSNNEYYIDDVLFEEVSTISDVSNPVLRSAKVYPNPVTDRLTIETTEQVDEIIIYNILGNPILKTTPNSASPVMEMGDFSPGIYLIDVRMGNETTTIKVTK